MNYAVHFSSRNATHLTGFFTIAIWRGMLTKSAKVDIEFARKLDWKDALRKSKYQNISVFGLNIDANDLEYVHVEGKTLLFIR